MADIYDSWGNTLSVQDGNGQEITSQNDIGNLNPFRYRGYYFDSDTGLYSLQNRYYDPQTCRFVNADAMIKSPGYSVLNSNMFTYCTNNPVIYSDCTGQWFGLDDIITGAVGAVVGVASQFVSDVTVSVLSGSWQISSWQTYVGAGIGGAIGGVATLGAISSKLFPVKAGGITTGRNNMSSVYKSGLTKLKNKTASRMSVKVMGKGTISSFVSDLGVSVIMGIKSYVIDTWNSYYYPQKPTYTGPVYWCAP